MLVARLGSKRGALSTPFSPPLLTRPLADRLGRYLGAASARASESLGSLPANSTRDPSMHGGSCCEPSLHLGGLFGEASLGGGGGRLGGASLGGGGGRLGAASARRVRCAVCRLPVKGLAWHCGRCGHGGHHACMVGWMSKIGESDGVARGGGH